MGSVGGHSDVGESKAQLLRCGHLKVDIAVANKELGNIWIPTWKLLGTSNYYNEQTVRSKKGT